MPARARRRSELLDLAPPLRRYASTLDSDPNASAFLVHEALLAAFSEDPELRCGCGLEASLREDIDRSFALQPPGPPPGPVVGPPPRER